MKIKKETIIDFSESFATLAKSMQGCNYVVEIEARKFEYQDDSFFNLDNLREIFFNVIDDPQKDINGELVESDMFIVFKTIKECLSFSSNESRVIDITTDQTIIDSRFSEFWSVINNNFNINAINKVFAHKAHYYSYLGMYIMWKFCYIFLNKNNKTGMVVVAGAFD